MSLLMSQEMVFACKSAFAVRASKVVAEKRMLRRPMDLFVSFQVFERNEASATYGTDLIPRAMPPSVMAVRCQQAVLSDTFRQTGERLTLYPTSKQTLYHNCRQLMWTTLLERELPTPS
jgi:hypothetical protein